ncbi:MAG: histidine phosphatase family protein [Acidimicrobiia bacterium]
MGSARIWLVRHGETEWTRSGQHTGTTDIELTGNGRDQARSLAPILAGAHLVLTLSSPMARARETARLAGVSDPEITDDLCELGYGEYEGLTTAEIRETNAGWSVWDDDAPGGERLANAAARCQRVIERVEGADGDVALFGHGHIFRILGATWIGLPPAGGRMLGLSPASVSILGYEHEYHVLDLWDLTPSFLRPA